LSSAEDTVTEAEAGPERSSFARRARMLRGPLRLLALVFVVQVFVFPQLGGARKAAGLLAGLDYRWVAAAVVAELAAWGAYAQLTRVLLPQPPALSLRSSASLVMTTLAVSHVLPGGQAAASAMAFQRLRDRGVDGSAAGLTLAAQSFGSAVVLNIILWFALLVSIPASGFQPIYATAAAAGAAVLAVVGLAVLGLSQGEALLTRVVRAAARRVPRLDEERVGVALAKAADQLRELRSDPRRVAIAAGWATLNWLLDAAALWFFLAAFGQRAGVAGLLVAFGLAFVLAAIPLTPGGLGVVEATLASLLVGFGTPRAEAALAIAGYRLLNFWLPIPLGALTYLYGGFRGALAERETAPSGPDSGG